MKCFVTGASGFIGSNLVHELVGRGHEVVALIRSGADLRGLEGACYQPVRGDILNPDLLVRAMQGCGWCFHVAASYHLWLANYASMYAANVDGTRNVFEAAARAGCSRIVHTSTVGCIGRAQEGPNGEPPSDEDTPVFVQQMTSHYKKSKWEAEQLALRYANQGLPIIIVNPSAPFGPRDFKPTPTGRVVLDFLNRKLPAYLDTGLNCVHVRDVAVGHILAAELGQTGQRYILGNADGNFTLRETFCRLERISGIPAPKHCIPHQFAFGAACISEVVARFTGRAPRATLAGVRMARQKMFFSPQKAIRELGLPQTPPDRALQDAVEWFTEHGYVR